MKKILFIFGLSILSACASSPPTSHLSLNKARLGHAVVSANDDIYVIAGSDRHRYLDSVEKVNLESQNVSLLEIKLTPRQYVTAVNDGNGNIYVMGGVSHFKVQGDVCNPQVEILNTQTGEILYGPPMPNPRRGASAVRIGNKIYVIGGSIVIQKPAPHIAASAKVDILDIKTQTWSEGAELPQAIETKAVVYNGQIYVVGGYNFVSSLPIFAKYDPESNTWERLENLPKVTSAESAIVVNDKLITFGDYGERDRVMMYDFKTHVWQQRGDLNLRPSRHQGVTQVNDSIYVIGGTGNGKDSLEDIQIFPVSSFAQ